jgi:hypothetical protein
MRTTSRDLTQDDLVALILSTRRRRRQRLAEGTWVLMRRRTLERRLINGVDPVTDPLVARRAAQLATPRSRERTACSLEAVVRQTRHIGGVRISNIVPASRREVRLAKPYLLEMIARLRDGRPIWPGGVARIREMLADGCGPLFTGERHGALREWAQEVLVELDHPRPGGRGSSAQDPSVL